MEDRLLGEFEELILLTAAALQDKAYGVSILQTLKGGTNMTFDISAIHVTLRRMKYKGFVKSRFGGITAERDGRRKKYYMITAFEKKVPDNQCALRTTLYQLIPENFFPPMSKFPPEYALKYLRWFCRDECLDEVEGDLLELLHIRVKRSPNLLGGCSRYTIPALRAHENTLHKRTVSHFN